MLQNQPNRTDYTLIIYYYIFNEYMLRRHVNIQTLQPHHAAALNGDVALRVKEESPKTKLV